MKAQAQPTAAPKSAGPPAAAASTPSPPAAPAARSPTGFADNQGVRIAYDVVGTGEPIVLVPGFSQSRMAWHEAGFAEAFAARGRQVVLIDPRGHGDSSKPHDPAAYGVDALTGDVVAVLDALAIRRADLVGYSRGGAIAIATAIQYPERCRAIAVGGAHPFAQDMGVFRQAVADGLQPWLTIVEAQAGPLPDSTRAMLLANDVDALRAAAAGDRPDRSVALAGSGVPASFFVGSEDPVRDPAARYAAATGAGLVILEGANHIQAFFEVEPVVDAVQRLSASLPA